MLANGISRYLSLNPPAPFIMRPEDVISSDPAVLGGIPVFRNTRVPVETLFDHLERGIPLDSFLEDFPTVDRASAVAVIDMAGAMVSSPLFKQFYAAAS
jgi:uncharacterized protein (DUF433 family)